jgi:solute carrier family 36 (proton-coupled amino acid transporter)
MLQIITISIYSFEGIGTILPIMSKAKNKHNFERNLMLALFTLGMVYAAFGGVCYAAYGQEISVLITDKLNPNKFSTTLVKILFVVNLVFTYSLLIYPVNQILEGYIFTVPSD